MTTSIPVLARRWLRWEFVPEAVLAVGLSAFFVDQNDAATSAFKSTKALAIMGTVGAGWLGARLVLARLVASGWARAAVFAVAAAVALSVVVLPAYDTETVIESFPAATSAPMPGTSADASGAARRTAALRGIDHRASGTAAIYRQPDGRYVVGLEDIDIQPGPDYDLYIVPGANRDATEGGVRLDDLRGNRGTQFYDVPAGINVDDGPWTVLVWCQTFAVPVAGATPA